MQNHTGVVAKRVVGLVWRQFANRQMDSNQKAPTSVPVDKSTQVHTIPTGESWQTACAKHANGLLPSHNSRLNLCNCAQCTNKQRFGGAVNKHKHSTKALRKTQQYQKVLVCKLQSTRLCNKKTVGTVQPFCFAFYASLSCASKVSRSMPCTIAACSTVSW